MIDLKKTVVLAPTSTTADGPLGSHCQFILTFVSRERTIFLAIRLDKHKVILVFSKNFSLNRSVGRIFAHGRFKVSLL